MTLPVARLPQSHVGGAVFGRCFELDEAAANPVRAELRGADLEVLVGLAAGFRDLAPAGADFAALSGIDPMIGRVVGHLVDRDDGKRRGDVQDCEPASGRSKAEDLGGEKIWREAAASVSSGRSKMPPTYFT
jgi:hypothetical protein